MNQDFTLEPPIGVELDEQLAQLRHRVISAMGADRRSHRPAWLFTASAAVAIGLVVALVLNATVGPRPDAAAALLRSAGGAAAGSNDPVVAPGQYLRIEFREVALDEMEYQGHTIAKLDRLTDLHYIPADSSTQWVWLRSYQPSTVFFGPKASEGFASLGPQHGMDLRALDGRFAGQDWTDGIDVAKIPLDPQGALEFFERRYGGLRFGGQRDDDVFSDIQNTLSLGTASAATRSALFGALALMPRVVIAERVANLDGRTGVAIGHSDAHGYSQEQLIFDPSTGEVIGSREIALKAQGPVPAGTVIESSAVTTSVVDSVPPQGNAAASGSAG